MQRNDRSYKDLKQKQKSAIADKTYKMHLKFYLENQRMPDATEMNDICKSLFTAVQSLAPKTEYEEFYKIVEKREKSYEERMLESGRINHSESDRNSQFELNRNSQCTLAN